MAHVVALLLPIWVPNIWIVQILTYCYMPKFPGSYRRRPIRILCNLIPSNLQYMEALEPHRLYTRSRPNLTSSSLRDPLALLKFLWIRVLAIAGNSNISASRLSSTFLLLVAISLIIPLASYNTLQIRPIRMINWITRHSLRNKYMIGIRLTRESWQAVLPIHLDSWGFPPIHQSLNRLPILLLARVLHILR